MSFATQALRYGWVALASLGALTGTTIYVLNNQRHQAKPEDIIELMLGITERCLALQVSTNTSAYGAFVVPPPSFVHTWFSNVYTTNGVTIYTNVVTNTIGWHFDFWYSGILEETIRTLVPLYLNTNTVYDGSTNISSLTVTGLWASLKIGDGTNRFTREPAWTNTFTNWIVNYTTYWPSTNGTATNICYTSTYQQVVNYAESWTATGGWVWVTSSNWASEIVTVTNEATYDTYPWQIYSEDLEERYKVLEAMRVTMPTLGAVSSLRGACAPYSESWAEAKSLAEQHFLNPEQDYYSWTSHYENVSSPVCCEISTRGSAVFKPINAVQVHADIRYIASGLSTSMTKTVRFWTKATMTWDDGHYFGVENNPEYGFYSLTFPSGLAASSNSWVLFDTVVGSTTNRVDSSTFGSPTTDLTPWCAEPIRGGVDGRYYGMEIQSRNVRALCYYGFLYCTNKYW